MRVPNAFGGRLDDERAAEALEVMDQAMEGTLGGVSAAGH